MSENYEEEHQKKVKNFKLNIEDESYIPVNEYNMEELEQQTKIEELSVDEKTEELPSDTLEIKSYTNPQNKILDEEKLENAENNNRKQTKRYDKKRKKQKSAKYGCIFRMIWLIAVVVVGILIAQFCLVGINDLLAINRTSDEIVSVSIPKDATIDEITEILSENNIINSTTFFKLYAKITKETTGYNQGTFELRKNMDYEAIINSLQSTQSRTDIVTIRFTEGMNIMEYAELLEENNVCSKEEFLETCNSDVFDEDYPFIGEINVSSDRYYKLEGYLFPDTYNFYENSNAETVIRKFLVNFRNKVYSKYRFSGYDKKINIPTMAENINLTLDEVIIMASIIQAEAANENDMYNISSVLHNRLSTLNNGGTSPYGDGGLDKLQSDATLFYPYASADDVPADISDTFVSNYDTYKISGLPAGSICNPSLAAIMAVLEPVDTNYYFFCHSKATEDSTAKAYYASTYYQHNINLKEAGLA